MIQIVLIEMIRIEWHKNRLHIHHARKGARAPIRATCAWNARGAFTPPTSLERDGSSGVDPANKNKLKLNLTGTNYDKINFV